MSVSSSVGMLASHGYGDASNGAGDAGSQMMVMRMLAMLVQIVIY